MMAKASGEITSDKLKDLKVVDLRSELEKRGLDKTGVLLERLGKELCEEKLMEESQPVQNELTTDNMDEEEADDTLKDTTAKQTSDSSKKKMDKIWHRGVIKYLQKKGLTSKDIRAEMVATLGDDAPALSTVQKWVAEFRKGRENLEDGPRSGRPATATTEGNIDRVHHMVMDDRRLTINQIANAICISRERVENILHNELGMTKVSARWVPHLLTPDQKHTRLIISQKNLTLFEADPAGFLERFLTQDEYWVHHFEPETKIHPSSPAPKKAKVVSSAGKVMASVFWDAKGIVFIDYLQKGRTINGEYYANLLRQLQKAIKTKRPGKLTKGVLFHQDIAPAHQSLVSMAVVHDCGFELVHHPPYSPDLAPSDYHLFPNMKKLLAGNQYHSDDDVITAVDDFFDQQDESFFTNGIQALHHRWKKCVDCKGDYVEK